MKNWIRPCTEVQKFEANVCATTCGIVNGQYVFTCDAPAGNVYIEYNGENYRLGGYGPCQKTHKTDGPSDGSYFDGYVDYNNNGKKDAGEGMLIWVEGFTTWTGWFGNTHVNVHDYHASASLTRSQVNVERS